MIQYIEFIDHSFLTVYLAENLGQDIFESLMENNLIINRLKTNSIDEINLAINNSVDIFAESVNQNWLIDILDTDINNLNLIEANSENNIFLYSSQIELKADDKKSLKKFGIEFVELKKVNEQKINQMAGRYCQQLELNQKEVQTLITQSKSYQEIINNLELISLADNKSEAIKSLEITEKTPLFFRTFNMQNIQRDSIIWANEVTDADLQLALSLIYTKLEKQQNAQVIQKLILTDQKIKTRSKINSLTWFKLFLWEVSKS
jgi:hypothetical protein